MNDKYVRIFDRETDDNQRQINWFLAERTFIYEWEKYHGDLLPIGASISITIEPPDPDNPTRYMTSTTIHFSTNAPDAIYFSPRRKWWQRLLGIPPRFDWPGDR